MTYSPTALNSLITSQKRTSSKCQRTDGEILLPVLPRLTFEVAWKKGGEGRAGHRF